MYANKLTCPIETAAIFVALLFLPCLALGAQRTIEVRRSSIGRAAYTDGGIAGHLKTRNDPAQSSRHYVWFDGSSEFEVPSGFEAIGYLQWLPGSGSKVFLVSGAVSLGQGQTPLESRLAIIQLVHSPSRGIVTVQSTSYPGVDLIAAMWDATANMLYVVDGVLNQVKWAPWSGVGSAFPQTFAVAFGQAEVPMLPTATQVSLVPIPGGVRIYDTWGGFGRDATWNGSFWTFVDYDPRSVSDQPAWHVANATTCPTTGSFTLELLGASGGTFDFQCSPMLDSSPPLFTGQHHGGQLAVACPSIFYDFPGRPYKIEGSGHRAVMIIPVVTYGSPVDTPQLSLDGNIRIPSLHCFVGVTQLLGPSCHLKLPGTNPSGTTRNAYMIYAVRDAAGNDPVGPVGTTGGYTITSGAMIVPFQVTFPAGDTERIARWRLDVPNLPVLENTVVLLQLAIEDGAGGLVYTSVRGTSVLPAWVDPRLRYGGDGARQSGGGGQRGRTFGTRAGYLSYLEELRRTRESRAAVQAAYSWLGLDERGNMRPAQLELLRRLRQRMAR